MALLMPKLNALYSSLRGSTSFSVGEHILEISNPLVLKILPGKLSAAKKYIIL